MRAREGRGGEGRGGEERRGEERRGEGRGGEGRGGRGGEGRGGEGFEEGSLHWKEGLGSKRRERTADCTGSSVDDRPNQLSGVCALYSGTAGSVSRTAWPDRETWTTNPLNALIRSRKNTVSRFETRALRGRPHQVYLIVRQPCAAPLMRRASFVKPRTALACSMPHKQRVE